MSKECPPDCTCKKHKAHYRGGSKKGRKFSPEARQRIAEGARKRKYTAEAKRKLAEHIREQHADPEWEAKRVAALQEKLTDKTCPKDCTCGKHADDTRQKISEARSGTTLSEEHKAKIGQGSREMWASFSDEKRAEMKRNKSEAQKKVWERERAEGKRRKVGRRVMSRHEQVLIPYMEALGYQHNRSMLVGRRVPDFIDENSHRIYEYFGTYWHPLGLADETDTIEYYAQHGWSCHVLWESDLYTFLLDHQNLVTPDQHDIAWRAAKINNGFNKAPSTNERTP